MRGRMDIASTISDWRHESRFYGDLYLFAKKSEEMHVHLCILLDMVIGSTGGISDSVG